MATFDVANYRVPGMSTAEMLATSRATISRVDKDSPEVARRDAKKVRQRAIELQDEWIRADAQEKRADARPVDQRLDRAWSGLYSRLESYGDLSPEEASDAADATALRDSLFPEGLTFLKLPYVEEWAQSEKILKRIDAEGHAKTIERMCDAKFLSNLRKAHDAYGKVLGVTEKGTAPAPAGVGVAMSNLSRALMQYVRVVGGTVDDDDEASIATAVGLLQPIADARARSLARSKAGIAASDAAAGTPDAPVEPPDAPIPAPFTD